MVGFAGTTLTASARCPTSMSQRATTQEATSFNLPSLGFIDVSRSDAPRASAHHVRVSDVRELRDRRQNYAGLPLTSRSSHPEATGSSGVSSGFGPWTARHDRKWVREH